MRRRQFLVTGATVLALGGGAGWYARDAFKSGPSTGGPATGGPTTNSALADDFSPPRRLGFGAWATLKSLKATAPIASLVLAGHDDKDAALATMEDALITRLGLADKLDIAAPDFADKLDQAIREDFRNGDLREVDHWLLSRTECQAVALRQLVFGAGPTREKTSIRDGHIVDISGWGPRQTTVNTPFNVQPDGHSGIWIKAEDAPPWVRFEIGGIRVRTFHSKDVVTTGLYGKLQHHILSKPGKYPVALVDEMAGIRQQFGVFVVKPGPGQNNSDTAADNAALCPVTNWGPRKTVAGTPANPQPGGGGALWIKTDCVQPGTQVYFGRHQLKTSLYRDKNLITASLPLSLLSRPGTFKVTLHDSANQTEIEVGDYVITAHGNPPRHK